MKAACTCMPPPGTKRGKEASLRGTMRACEVRPSIFKMNLLQLQIHNEESGASVTIAAFCLGLVQPAEINLQTVRGIQENQGVVLQTTASSLCHRPQRLLLNKCHRNQEISWAGSVKLKAQHLRLHLQEPCRDSASSPRVKRL